MEKEKKDGRQWARKWLRVNFTLYFNEFNPSILTICLISLAAIYLFHRPIVGLINWLVVGPLFATIPQGIAADLIFIFFAVGSARFAFEKLGQHLLPSFNSIIVSAFCLFGYYVLWLSRSGYELTHFSLNYFAGFTYGTVFLISLLPLVATYKAYFCPLHIDESYLSFVEDSPNIERYADIYNRQDFSDTLFNHIMATTTSSAFVIGVIGDWGSGKTDLNERLKQKLGTSDDNIILDFNAWRVNKPDLIIESFYKALSVKLRPFNHSISGKIREYSKKILQPGKEFQYRLLDTVIGELLPEEDLQSQYEYINAAVKSTGKRLVIFIDDTDRLSGKEVMEVLRLVRNSANFANTFFVIGIDYSYIVSSLTQSKEYANEAEYLKKIFQFSITLPSVKKDIFLQEVRALLETKDIKSKEKDRISGGLGKVSFDRKDLTVQSYPGAAVEGLLEDLLENMRDVKRFVNSFKVAFNLVKDEADIHDLIVLELIRNKNIVVYNEIRSKKLPNYSLKTYLYEFSENNWTEFVKRNPDRVPSKDVEVLKRAVEYLFSNPGYKNGRKLLDPSNFYIYFSYQLFNQISLARFNNLLNKDAREMMEGFGVWIGEGKEGDLLKILQQLELLPDADFLHKIIVVLCSMRSTNPGWAMIAGYHFYQNREFNLTRYFAMDEKRYREFIQTIMTDSSISLLVRAKLAYLYVEEIVNGGKGRMFLSQREWQRIAYGLFDEYLSRRPTDIDEIIEFYRLNDYRRDTTWIILYPPAGRRLRRFLLETPAMFEQFTRGLIMKAPGSSVGYYQIAMWYILSIFSVPLYLKSILEIRAFSEPKAEKARKTILEHFDRYLVDGKPFPLAEQDRPE